MSAFTWTGFDGSWNSASEWRPHHVPTGTDVARFTVVDGYTVTSAQDNAIKTVDFLDGAPTLAITAGTFSAHRLIGAGTVTLSAGATIDNNGPQTLLNATTIDGAGTIGDASHVLWNQDEGVYGGDANDNGTIDADSAQTLTLAFKTIINWNVIESTGSGGLVITGKLNNTGELDADGGNITVDGRVTGYAPIEITNATVDLESSANANQTVYFKTAAGTLALGKAQSFAGTIGEFAVGNAIDLKNFAFANTPFIESITGSGRQNSDTVILIKDGPSNLTASITLVNQYTGEFSNNRSAYTFTSDQNGANPGTLFELAAPTV